MSLYVIPAEAGIQLLQGFLDPGFRRGDGIGVLRNYLKTPLPWWEGQGEGEMKRRSIHPHQASPIEGEEIS
jgi:hypothetical protein